MIPAAGACRWRATRKLLPLRPLAPLLSCLICSLAACTRGTPEPVSPSPSFADVTAAAGIDFIHDSGASGRYAYPETFGAGAAWLDYDADGWLDLYLIQGGRVPGSEAEPKPNRLYRNNGSAEGVSGPGFVDVTERTGAGHVGYGMGAVAADLDANGAVALEQNLVGVAVRPDGQVEPMPRETQIA